MGCCASKDLDKKKSWSPSETNNGVGVEKKDYF